MKNKSFIGILLASLILCALTGCGETETLPVVTPIPIVSISGTESPTESAAERAEVDSAPETRSPEPTPVAEQPDEAEPELVAEQPDGTDAETAANDSTAVVVGDQSITLVMVGDILLHTPVEKSARTEDGSYDFSPIFTQLKGTIADADLALVNQEVIIGGEELGVSGYPAFNAPVQIADALVETGFDVILHATNHALDKGKKGLTNCLNYWQENYPDIAVLGIYDSQEKRDSLYLYEQNGITVAVLDYTYGTNGISLPEGMPYAVNLLDENKVKADLLLAEELADFTIVTPHWGTEYRLECDSYQKKWAKIFLEGGADLVIGTHPHVIEPITWYENEETGDDMLVYYSLGNFVNWTSGTGEGVSNRMVGGMASVTLEKNTDGDVVIADYGVEALVCHVTEGIGGVTVYPVSAYSEELASENAIRSQAADFSYDYVLDLCDDVWGDLWY